MGGTRWGREQLVKQELTYVCAKRVGVDVGADHESRANGGAFAEITRRSPPMRPRDGTRSSVGYFERFIEGSNRRYLSLAAVIEALALSIIFPMSWADVSRSTSIVSVYKARFFS